jgi:hypothetical protein
MAIMRVGIESQQIAIPPNRDWLPEAREKVSEGYVVSFVIPAKADSSDFSNRIFWIPAVAGMTFVRGDVTCSRG